MILPWAQAHPAEVGAAYLTRHMVTSLIFLNWSLALLIRAHFGVGHDPRQILALAIVFHLPLLPHITVRRPVLFLPAFETKTVATLTIDDVLRVVVGDTLSCEVTFL
jgi:hypothetical protein